MNNPEYIVLHHSAVLRDDNDNQFDAIKNYHISKGWGDIGYHWLIEPNGDIKQGRKENVAGAHCYQENMNTKSIGICLTGNFDEEEPTEQQLESLEKLISEIKERHDIKVTYGHRYFASYKSCPGMNFTDSMINSYNMRNLFEETIYLLKTLWGKQSDEDKKAIGELGVKLRDAQKSLGIAITEK